MELLEHHELRTYQGMMLSHGGAGVVNATLRAGIPPAARLMGPCSGSQEEIGCPKPQDVA